MAIALFTVDFSHLHHNIIQHVCEAISDYLQFLSETSSHIHVRLHCNANEKLTVKRAIYKHRVFFFFFQIQSFLNKLSTPRTSCSEAIRISEVLTCRTNYVIVDFMFNHTHKVGYERLSFSKHLQLFCFLSNKCISVTKLKRTKY